MLKQNTPEWLKMRRSKVGASDAPIIMGVSPYTTPYQLWQLKLQLIPDPEETEGMRRGRYLEEKARHELEKMTGLLLAPEVRFHEAHKWMMASLDAVDVEGKYIAEIKCPGTKDHAIALSGKVPEKYFPQVQHQMEVCQKEECYYFSFDGKEGVLFKVYRDDPYIKKMIEKEKEFWEKVQTFTAPDLCDRDYVKNDSFEWELLANEWKQVTDSMKSLEKKEEDLRKRLISLCQYQNTLGSGIWMSKCIRKGNIDYSSIPELKTLDLEKYRKKSSEYWKISENS